MKYAFAFWGLILSLAHFTPSAPGQEAAPLRVMTYNIHHGEGTDGRIDLERIAQLILEQKPGLVGLQEVDRGVQRTQRRDFPAELARLTGFSCVFSNNFHYQGGEYGNAILSRFPVVQTTNTHYRMLRPAEQRGLLQIVVEIAPNQRLCFMNTHLDFRPDDSERLSNVEEIRAAHARFAALPVILCGDFNDVPDSRTYQGLRTLFQDAWPDVKSNPGFTIPSSAPKKRIDFIFYAGAELKPVKAWIPKSEASDHLAVVAEFDLLRRP